MWCISVVSQKCTAKYTQHFLSHFLFILFKCYVICTVQNVLLFCIVAYANNLKHK